MKYTKGFGLPLVLVAIGVLVAVAIVGFVLQRRTAGERAREEAIQTTGVRPSPAPIVIDASDATDTKLNKDFSDIDTSVNAINVDAASIDAGLNDKMGDLSE